MKRLNTVFNTKLKIGNTSHKDYLNDLLYINSVILKLSLLTSLCHILIMINFSQFPFSKISIPMYMYNVIVCKAYIKKHPFLHLVLFCHVSYHSAKFPYAKSCLVPRDAQWLGCQHEQIKIQNAKLNFK